MLRKFNDGLMQLNRSTICLNFRILISFHEDASQHDICVCVNVVIFLFKLCKYHAVCLMNVVAESICLWLVDLSGVWVLNPDITLLAVIISNLSRTLKEINI